VSEIHSKAAGASRSHYRRAGGASHSGCPSPRLTLRSVGLQRISRPKRYRLVSFRRAWSASIQEPTPILSIGLSEAPTGSTRILQNTAFYTRRPMLKLLCWKVSVAVGKRGAKTWSCRSILGRAPTMISGTRNAANYVEISPSQQRAAQAEIKQQCNHVRYRKGNWAGCDGQVEFRDVQ
jgi:hypothetical protein